MKTRNRCGSDFIADPIPVWKRAIDLVASGLGLLLLSPLLLLVVVAVKLSSPGPAFLKQKRVGREGKTFTIWKFRTMRQNADHSVHQQHLKRLIEMDMPMMKLDSAADPRVFPLGKLIRRSYIDELPQLINVFRGEMSLVGPRPCLPYEAERFKPWQRARFRILPGMTGLWQVSGKNRTTFTQMIEFDIEYADRLSFWLDAKILLKTVPVIVSEMSGRLAKYRTVQRQVTVARKNT